MNIPAPLNVDHHSDKEKPLSSTKEKSMDSNETTTVATATKSSMSSSSSPEDILDDIASQLMIKTNINTVTSDETIKLDETSSTDFDPAESPSSELVEPTNVVVEVDEKDVPPSTPSNDVTESTKIALKETTVAPSCDDSLVENGDKANNVTATETKVDDKVDDEEIKLAFEMAMAAAQNPHLSPLELQRLVGSKNMQVKMINEFAKQNETKIKQNQIKHRELQRIRSNVSTSNSINGGTAITEKPTTITTTTVGVASSWWTAAAKKAEEMKDRAERSLYAEQISNDPTIMELRKTMKVLKKTLKAHRLQGNRVETRHAFKRQRMEKRLIQSTDKLKKTQEVFTNSSYNVQEYVKAMLRASKKWRKIGTDDELLYEAQLSRNMHQMLALEKQKVKCKKNTKEMKKYLQRCKGWLSDKKAFCEMNIMTIDATQNSIIRLYEETLRRQDKLILRYKASEEFHNVDLTDVDLSHVTMPNVTYIGNPNKTNTTTQTTSTNLDQSSSLLLNESFSAMRGLPIVDSIRKKKGYLDHSYHSEQQLQMDIGKHSVDNDVVATTTSRRELLEEYYKNQRIAAQQQSSTTAPELYVVANKDDESVSSRLSDPDASFNNGHHDSFAVGGEDLSEEDDENDVQNEDAPWNAANRHRYNSNDSSSDDITAGLINEIGIEMSTEVAPDTN